MTGEQALLCVSGLKVAYASSTVDVVDDISFQVGAGSVMGLVGESGSGKTTVALALLAHARRGLRIAAGRIEVRGVDLLGLRGADLAGLRGKQVAYVAQDPTSALNPGRTIGWQLREPLLRHGVPGGLSVDERLGHMLEEVKLEGVRGVLSAFPHQLSGGQQQRVMLAMAFACRPDVIILDEPTTGLDVTTQRRVLDTVRELCVAYGTAAVYVSHDLAVVAELADAVAVMYAGRIVEYGPTHEVFEGARHPYTEALLAALPGSKTGGREADPGQAPRPGQRPDGCAFAARCRYVQDQCRQQTPPARRLGAHGHYACCIRADELRVGFPEGSATRGVAPQPRQAAPILAMELLSAWYGKKQVLDSVSVEVACGQTLAIVGESGSGKTTLARCIVGLHQRWSGAITYDGDALPNDPSRRTAKCVDEVQYVFQNPYTSLNPRKTIRQLVEQPLRARLKLGPRERLDRAVQALEDAALSSEVMDRYPDQLSGGERQRVAIARALVLRPRLLVCDEITSALDVSVQASIVRLLQTLQSAQQLTLLFITHNLPLVEMIAQTTAVMTEGRVVEVGATKDVLSRPTNEYTQRLLADAPKLIQSGRNAPVPETSTVR